MRTSRAWIVYSVVRLLAVLVPFAVVMFIWPSWQWNWLAGIVVGSLVGIAVSVIFLHRERMAIGESIMHHRESVVHGQDAQEEDALLDAPEDAQPESGDANRS